jgi:small-conductance mechanosensitive channel
MTTRAPVLLAALAVLWLAPPLPARAQDSAPPPTSPIPTTEIASRAAEVTALLETVDALSAPTPERLEIERALPERRKRLEAGWESTLRRLAAGPSAPQLDDMTTAWEGVRAELQAWADRLGGQASRLQQELRRLSDLQAAWSRSRGEAQASATPPEVLQEIQGILGGIRAAEVKVNTRLASLLVLQYQVGLLLRRCDQALARIAQAQAELTQHLGRRTAQPVWSAALWESARRQLLPGIQAATTRWGAGLRSAAQNRARAIGLQALLFAALLFAMLRARRSAAAEALPGAPATGAAPMLRRPVSAALTLALLATPWLYPGYSLSIFRTAKLLGVIPAVRLLAPVLSRPQARCLRAFGAVMAVEAVRPLLVTAPDVDHLLFLGEMLAAAALLGLILLGRRVAGVPVRLDVAPAARALPRIAAILGLACTLALLAGAAGYMQLARLVGDAALQSTYAALVILLSVWVVLVLLGYGLRARPLGSLQAVRRNRELLERNAGRLLRTVGVVVWVLASLRPFTVFGNFGELVQAVLAAGVGWGNVRLTLGDALLFGGIVGGALLLAAAVRAVLEDDVFPRIRLAQGVPLALANLTRYAIVLTGFLVAMAALGVDLTKVTILVGAFGVALGFGLQTLVGNFAAGLILLFERPIREGDAVQVGDVQGEVRHIGVRASIVRTSKGAVVFVPNGQLLTEKITNWTYAGRKLRIDLPVTVAVSNDPRHVIALLCRVGQKHPEVAPEPPPAALCLGVGAGGLAFELRVWTTGFERADDVRSELAEAVYAALTEAKVAFK